MAELTLSPQFLQDLILKTRGVMAETGAFTEENAEREDEEAAGTFIADATDMSADELIAQIDDLEPDQQAELVALFWIGRGDMEAEEWDEALQLAAERSAGSTAEYLLSHPHIAEHWDEELDKIFDGSDLVESGEY